MKWKSYLILCACIAVVTALSVLFIPGLAQGIEAELIAFLSSNA